MMESKYFGQSPLLERDASLAEWKGHIRTQAPKFTKRPASKKLLGLFGTKSI